MLVSPPPFEYIRYGDLVDAVSEVIGLPHNPNGSWNARTACFDLIWPRKWSDPTMLDGESKAAVTITVWSCDFKRISAQDFLELNHGVEVKYEMDKNHLQKEFTLTEAITLLISHGLLKTDHPYFIYHSW